MRLIFAAVTLLAAALAFGSAPLLATAEEPITVFAAASLSDAMTAAGEAYQRKTGQEVRFSFAASSTLARQIDYGAPAAIFASANTQWMDRLEANHLIARGTRSHPIANRLALIAPKAAAPAPLELDSSLDLSALLGPDGRLAVGDPAHVPAGLYAKQALESLDLWSAAEPRLARADNVRAALALVGRGEAPLGIAYATDALISDDIVVAGIFPEGTHDPIVYPFALLTGGDSEEARAFLAFLTGDEGLAVFESFGFARTE